MDVIILKNYKPLVVYSFKCMALFHSQTQCHMLNCVSCNVSHYHPKTDVQTVTHILVNFI